MDIKMSNMSEIIVSNLRSENDSLINDLSYCQKLFKLLLLYRKLATDLSKRCKCGQTFSNNNKKSFVNQLETEFNLVYDKRRVFQIRNKINNKLKLNLLKTNKFSNDLTQTLNFDDLEFNDINVGDNGSEGKSCDNDLIEVNNDESSGDEEVEEEYECKPKLKSGLKRLNGNKYEIKRKRRVRKNLNNKELLDGLENKVFVEVVDQENEWISVIREKTNPKTEGQNQNVSELGSIVGFKCNGIDCLFVTYRKDTMRGHITGKHSNQRPFNCDECEKTFTTKKYLDSHKANVHSSGQSGQITKIKCEFPECQYATQFQSQMTIHVMRHKKERTFRCDQCESGFCSKGDLNIHIRLVHKNLRPYMCEWPGCEAAFKTISAFNVHKTIHSNDKSFVCDFGDCRMCFSTNQNLKRHKESHDLVKRHVCAWPACEQSFSRRYRLIAHMKKHTLNSQQFDSQN